MTITPIYESEPIEEQEMPAVFEVETNGLFPQMEILLRAVDDKARHGPREVYTRLRLSRWEAEMLARTLLAAL